RPRATPRCDPPGHHEDTLRAPVGLGAEGHHGNLGLPAHSRRIRPPCTPCLACSRLRCYSPAPLPPCLTETVSWPQRRTTTSRTSPSPIGAARRSPSPRRRCPA